MIVIVDDTRPIVHLLCTVFRHAGFEAVGFTDAQSAMPFIEAHAPNLMVIDYHMPGISGLALLKWVREHKALDDSFVIIQSSDADAARLIPKTRRTLFVSKSHADWLDLPKVAKKLLAS